MQDYDVVIPARWRYLDHKRGPQTVEAGTYRVPAQMKDAVARMAIERGAGHRMIAATSRKTRAPSNKARGSAPSNKSSLE